MRVVSFRPLATLAAALGSSLASMSSASSLPALRPAPVIIPGPKRRNRSKRLRRRSGRFYPFSSARQQRREARLAAKMRASRRMNDDMLVRHRPKNSGPGMDLTRPSRQVRRAEARSEAKARARSYCKGKRVFLNWRGFVFDNKLRASADAARAAE